MNDLQKKLDTVIRSVQSRLIQTENLIPVKIENGIQIGTSTIINKDTLKDVYHRNSLIASGVHLNKIAIKIANLAAISYFNNQLRIKELIGIDQQFGDSLKDYLLFREKYKNSKAKGDYIRSDIHMARMCYSKDRAAYFKKQALRLVE
jgi:hypothetical protein